MIQQDELMTLVRPLDFRPKITFRDRVTLVGSCFAEHISQKLLRYKYNVLSNPFGILYNPVSIAVTFERILKREWYHADELIFHDGLYHSMDHHGSFSGKDPEKVIQSINSEMESARQHLEKSLFVFVSLGSAKVYRYKKTAGIAGNCHKIPQTDFESFRLTLQECISATERTQKAIHQISPNAQIIWTISPVRHLRDGLEENQLSKSTLLLAMDHQLKSNQNSYFPAYEFMIDQLRDYRYYARDLTHPSSLAIDLIWEKFVDTYIDPHETEIHRMIEKVHRAMEHRILQENPDSIRLFARKQLDHIEHLAGLHPDLDWKEEREYFSQLIEKT
jgi:hypothetical protein